MKKPILSSLNIDDVLRAALREDMNGEDISTQAILDRSATGQADLICKEEGILAGVSVFKRVFELLDDNVTFDLNVDDGSFVKKMQKLGTITGPIHILLSGERVSLNYLQRMSGIATYTKKMIDRLGDESVLLVDTRKTTPLMRPFEKYAVRIGGGGNHRYNLSDGVLLKDNHIGAAGSVTEAVRQARSYAPFVRKIEVEVETMEMVQEAVDAKADIIMLDNMTIDQIKEAIAYIDGRAMIELSGNINMTNIHEYCGLGADIISSGALTHSATVLDFSLKGLKRIG